MARLNLLINYHNTLTYLKKPTLDTLDTILIFIVTSLTTHRYMDWTVLTKYFYNPHQNFKRKKKEKWTKVKILYFMYLKINGNILGQ